MPLRPEYYSARTTFVDSVEAAEAMGDLARQRPLGWVGFDTEFRYDRPGVLIDKDHTAYDPRSVRPLLLSLSMAEPDDGGGTVLYDFVVDLRRRELLDAVRDVFRIPCRFVGHYSQSELFCLWRLGILEPTMLWDTWVCERALHLGRNHRKYRAGPGTCAAQQARSEEEVRDEEEFRYTLAATCRRHGVAYPFAGDKDRLQRSFLTHPADAPFTREQIDYASADAGAVARLYPAQLLAASRAGILHHLETVEMAWTATNAGMAWRGVKIDREKCRRVAEACDRHLAALLPALAAEGVADVRSPKQLAKFFADKGLLPLFRRGTALSFDKKQLEALQGRHPAIAKIRAARRAQDLRRDKILVGEFDGIDGRVHPNYRQLGTHTGRQTSSWPNLLGLGRVFRPLIVPETGRGIGEVDLSQIEIGIAGAVFGDERLVDMYNTGDVYSAMAQDFYRDRLSESERELGGAEFKRAHRGLRDRMKACTLGIIFGLTAHGLSSNLDIGVAEAAALLARFMAMFPTLERALSETANLGVLRGYVATTSGLRRHRASKSAPRSPWELNWMKNHPVQGSACVVFKAAGNRLERLYRRNDAWLIVAMHDAYVYEAPLGALSDVGNLTRRVLRETVEEHFPILRPDAEINNSQPGCWNKDGHADSVERWIDDPAYFL